MELSGAVELLTTEHFFSVFDPTIAFKGRINPFAEVTNSGSSAQRRILETPISEMIPAGRVISGPEGIKYIVANQSVDYWNGSPIRHKYSILPTTTIGAVGNIGETLAGVQPDKEVYTYTYFVRREISEGESSDYLSGYEIYFPSVKFFTRGMIVKVGNDFYRLKTDTWVDGAGYCVAQALRLESPMVIMTIEHKDTGGYDAASDTFSTEVITSVLAFVEPLIHDFEFISPSFSKVEVGDVAISILKSSAVLEPGDLAGGYKVLAVRDLGDYSIYQCRNALC